MTKITIREVEAVASTPLQACEKCQRMEVKMSCGGYMFDGVLIKREKERKKKGLKIGDPPFK